MSQKHVSLTRQNSVLAYTPLIEQIAKQEYYRITDPRISYATVARLAALAVRIAILSGCCLNLNMLSCLIRNTIRQELSIYYAS